MNPSNRPRAASRIHAAVQAVAAATLTTGVAQAQDAWRDAPVPAAAGADRSWVLAEGLSDGFDYADRHDGFLGKWRDAKPDGWLGPGATYFTDQNYFFDDGRLTIFGSRVPEPQRGEPRWTEGYLTDRNTHTSYITSDATLRPGSYTEVRMKPGGTALSSNFWLLSDDNETEIDVVEVYGDNDWFRHRPATNVHFFKRGGDGDLNNQVQHVAAEGHDGNWHDYGVHWKTETELDFYYDGLLVRELDLPTEILDPTAAYLNREMRLVIDLEAHAWRKDAGVPGDADLLDWNRNNLQVDWVRTFIAAESPPVPEPASAALLAAGTLLLRRRTR